MDFFPKLTKSQNEKKSSLCVGLDPNPHMFPEGFTKTPEGIYRFLSEIIKATAPHVIAYKPQIAYFSAFRAEDVLEQLIADIHQTYPDIQVILDAKRGDIGTTASMYAREVFERYKADAVTVNPYMGADTVKPFTGYREKGVFLLCRTSNPSAPATQNVEIADGGPYFNRIAELATTEWNTHENIGLVVGATAENELRQIRETAPNAWFLVPGVGAQGGSVEAVMESGSFVDGGGVVINSSRGILYRSQGQDFADAAAEGAQRLHTEMKEYL